MDQPYELHREIPMFEDRREFTDDLTRAARRANLLAWTMSQMVDAAFRVDQNNEWVIDLSSLFLEIVRNDMSKARALSEEIWRADLDKAAAERDFEAAKKEAEAASQKASMIEQVLQQHLMDAGISAPRSRAVVDEIVGRGWKGKPLGIAEAVLLIHAEEPGADEHSKHMADAIRAKRDTEEVIQ